jgi:hypothetical protein
MGRIVKHGYAIGTRQNSDGKVCSTESSSSGFLG